MSSDKFVAKKGEMHLIENKDMVCKDCIFAYEHSAIECIMYNQKPLRVIDGGNCEKKEISIEEVKKKLKR